MSEISIQEAMQQFLQKSKLKQGIQAVQIEDAWEQIMGKTIAKYTDSIRITGQTLYIHTTVAPLRNELLFQKEAILKRVNEVLGEKAVKDVVIR